jgi:hypothetical protein
LASPLNISFNCFNSCSTWSRVLCLLAAENKAVAYLPSRPWRTRGTYVIR